MFDVNFNRILVFIDFTLNFNCIFWRYCYAVLAFVVDINIDSTAGIFEHVEIVRDAFNDIAAQGYLGVVTQGFCAFYSCYAAVWLLEFFGLTLRC